MVPAGRRPAGRSPFGVALVAALLIACAPPPTGAAIGVVISIESTGPTAVTGFRLRTAAGETVDFDVGRLDLSDGGLPAPHLHDHLRDGEPIEVEYVVEGGRYVVLRYIDAPASSQEP